jgi:hypothetical protein
VSDNLDIELTQILGDSIGNAELAEAIKSLIEKRERLGFEAGRRRILSANGTEWLGWKYASFDDYRKKREG